ncbi:MarR family winged helix-turn-helix transcriptional regulator [Amycolatopsis lexingtonensis]|uniref:MarR family winged helix-turn-helix transcriptional regulator n=1 Tax=Amycolatopsis lexingtonensis TaxID=218822 RepID=UPI003F70F1F7
MDVPPLDQAEMRMWTRLAAVSTLLIGELDARLLRSAGLSHFEYVALSRLSEAPDRTMSMSTLAARTNATPSRMSHMVTRLERRGYVERSQSPESGRVVLATLTDEGWQLVIETAPLHRRDVRELVIDAIDPAHVGPLGESLGRILERLDPGNALAQRD